MRILLLFNLLSVLCASTCLAEVWAYNRILGDYSIRYSRGRELKIKNTGLRTQSYLTAEHSCLDVLGSSVTEQGLDWHLPSLKEWELLNRGVPPISTWVLSARSIQGRQMACYAQKNAMLWIDLHKRANFPDLGQVEFLVANYQTQPAPSWMKSSELGRVGECGIHNLLENQALHHYGSEVEYIQDRMNQIYEWFQVPENFRYFSQNVVDDAVFNQRFELLEKGLPVFCVANSDVSTQGGGSAASVERVSDAFYPEELTFGEDFDARVETPSFLQEERDQNLTPPGFFQPDSSQAFSSGPLLKAEQSETGEQAVASVWIDHPDLFLSVQPEELGSSQSSSPRASAVSSSAVTLRGSRAPSLIDLMADHSDVMKQVTVKNEDMKNSFVSGLFEMEVTQSPAKKASIF